MIVDSHCHLDDAKLFEQLDEIVKRAIENQVKYLLTICTTLNSFEKIKFIINKYKNIFGTFGIHPHETKNFKDINSEIIQKNVKKYNKIVGIGETGLDYYYTHSDKSYQKRSFVEHINAASELKIPIIVHTRNAEKDTYEILKSEKKNSDLNILIHCFTGTSDFAKKLLDLDCYISISGIVTFENSSDLLNTVKNIPIDRLLVETDSPYLAPTPYRGKINEPSYIKHTVNKISSIKGLSLEKTMEKTSNNFFKMFKLK